MPRQKLEKRVHKLAALIGVSYKDYLGWVRKDWKATRRNLKLRWRAEFIAHLRLRENADKYKETEMNFYGNKPAGQILKDRSYT